MIDVKLDWLVHIKLNMAFNKFISIKLEYFTVFVFVFIGKKYNEIDQNSFDGETRIGVSRYRARTPNACH